MRKLAGLVATAAILAGGVITGVNAQETIKIGVTQPLTGAFAASGNYVAQGAKIAEDEINKAGGVIGKKIQLIIEDNKSNPTEAVSTVEKLYPKRQSPGPNRCMELHADFGGDAQARGVPCADDSRDVFFG